MSEIVFDNLTGLVTITDNIHQMIFRGENIFFYRSYKINDLKTPFAITVRLFENNAMGDPEKPVATFRFSEEDRFNEALKILKAAMKANG